MHTEQTSAPEVIDQQVAIAEQYDRPWLGSLLRPLLIVLMVGCVDVVVLAFLRQYASGMPGALQWTIWGMGMVAAIVGCTTTTWLALPDQRLRRSIGYRAAELTLLLAVARIAVWLSSGGPPALTVALNQPLTVLLDGPFLLAAVTILFTWFAAVDFTDDLAQLALQPDEIWLGRQVSLLTMDTTRPAQTDRSTLLRRFVGRWVGWGIFLIVITSTLRLGITRTGFWTLAHQDIHPGVIGAVILYYLTGLILISQGQLAVLRARWILDRLPSTAAIFRNWPVYTLVLLAIIAGIAVVMPLGDTFLISQVLTLLLDILFSAIFLLFRLVSVLLLFLLSLLPHSGQTLAPRRAPLEQELAPPAVGPVAIPPWLGGALFWTSILLLIAYAAYIYFSEKETSLRWLHRLWALLRQRWWALWSSWRQWRPMGRLPREGGSGAGKAFGRSWLRDRIRWRWLTPLQQIRYLYFQMLEVAARHDLGRKPGETPVQYAPRLRQELVADGEDGDAIDALTEAFVRVRYANATVNA
ncbi:MAG: DUF4129 domain-containing protein, partial [Caldilineaceae bacterium]|nr:DUF4129 domain-containing protein [Caldilineaceae bacterium]